MISISLPSDLNFIESVLNEHGIKCTKENSALKVTYSIKDIYTKYEILIENLNEYICIKTVFPFSVNQNAILFMSMFIAERNETLKFSAYGMDFHSGRVYLKCGFKMDGLSEKSIWIYYTAVWLIAQKDFKKLMEIAEGKISNEQLERYKYFFTQSEDIIPKKSPTIKIPEFMKESENLVDATVNEQFDVFEFFS